MNIKQWYLNRLIIRVKIKYKNKYQEKYNRDIREIQQKYEKKLLEATDLRSKDLETQQKNYEKVINSKDNEINKILETSTKRTEEARIQTENLWKGIVAERDDTIKNLQDYKLNMRQEVIRLRKCTEEFEQNKDEMIVDCESAEYYVKKGLQKLIKNVKSDKFINIHKTLDEIEDNLKE